jgi:hypothetical protein
MKQELVECMNCHVVYVYTKETKHDLTYPDKCPVCGVDGPRNPLDFDNFIQFFKDLNKEIRKDNHVVSE